MSHSPSIKTQYYEDGRSSRHENGGGGGGGGSGISGANDHHRYQNGSSHKNNDHISRSTHQHTDRTYSLPRTVIQQQQQLGYYTQDRRNRSADRNLHSGSGGRDVRDGVSGNGGSNTPDFYFMPSQRKYSGEVVRVYVDYNKDPKN